MTSIAYDGKTLAADSQISSGNVVFGHRNKIIRLKKGWLAWSGSLYLVDGIVRYVNTGRKPEKVGLDEERGDDGVSCLVVLPDGSAYEIDQDLLKTPACIPWAGGSGMVFVLAAMKMGKTARQAVKFACKMDCYSSKPIYTVGIK